MRDTVITIVRTLVVFIAPIFVLAGWVKWVESSRATEPRKRREYAIAAGLGAASISCICYFSVVGYLQRHRMGYWGEYLVASAWAKFNWPLSVLAGIFGLSGKGDGRGWLLIAASWLVFVWTIAFIH